MPVNLAKLAKVSALQKSDLDFLRTKAADSFKDTKGSVASNFAAALRLIGVSDYLLNGDCESFRNNLSEASRLQLQLFDRFDQGDAISPSYVSMLTYRSLFDALAAGDLKLSVALAGKMGGRDEIESEYDDPFDRALGYAMKGVVLQGQSASRDCLVELRAVSANQGAIDFIGYCDVLTGISEKSIELVNRGLILVVQGHKNQCKPGGAFRDTEDELLCVWGVGIANLALAAGLPVKSPDRLVPQDLLLAPLLR